MNTDFRLATGIFEHPKFLKLQRRLGDGGALSYLRLLRFVAVNRPDGSLHEMDDDDVTIAAGYQGDAAEFVKTLLDLRLLDRDADDSLWVHDWEEHNPYAANAAERSDKAQKAARARWGRRDDAPGETGSAPKPGGTSHPHSGNAQSQTEQCSEHDLALPLAASGNAPAYQPSFPPTKPDLPSNNNPPTPHEQADGGDCHDVVVALLSDQGVSVGVAEDLARRFGCEEVRRQVEWHRYRLEEKNAAGSPARNPAGLLCRAIEGRWAIPPTARQAQLDAEARRKRAEQTARAAESDRARQEVARADLARCQAAFSRLAPEEQEAVDRETREKVRAESVVFRERLDKGQMGPALRARLTTARNEILAERGHVAPPQADKAPPEGKGE